MEELASQGALRIGWRSCWQQIHSVSSSSPNATAIAWPVIAAFEASRQVLGDDRTTNGALSVRTIGLACGGEAGDQCSIIWFEIEYISQLF